MQEGTIIGVVPLFALPALGLRAASVEGFQLEATEQFFTSFVEAIPSRKLFTLYYLLTDLNISQKSYFEGIE